MISAGPYAEVCRHTSNIDGARQRSKGEEANRKAAIYRFEAVEGRERDRRTKDDFNQRMEDIGVWGDERVLLVMSKLDGGRRQWEGGRCSKQTVPISGGQGRKRRQGGGGIEIKTEIDR